MRLIFISFEGDVPAKAEKYKPVSFMVKTSYYDQDIANHNQTKIVFDVVMDMV